MARVTDTVPLLTFFCSMSVKDKVVVSKSFLSGKMAIFAPMGTSVFSLSSTSP